MFDDVKNDQSQDQNPKQNFNSSQPPVAPPGGYNQPPSSPSAPSGQSQPGKVEDIFAGVDTGGMPDGKPSQFQPKTEAPPTLDGKTGELAKENKKKLTMLLAIVIILLLIIAGGVYGFMYFSSQGVDNSVLEGEDLAGNNSKNIEENLNAEENNIEEDINNNSEEENIDEEIHGDIFGGEIEEPVSTKDADQDGLTDEEERKLGTNLNDTDTDGDGLYDMEEVRTYKTDPLNKDTDSDGYLDGEEVGNGYNPNGEGKLIKDTIEGIIIPKINNNIF